MHVINFRFILIALILVIFFATTYNAQGQEESQRDYIKKQVHYYRWQNILGQKTEVRYDAFQLDSTIVKPWRIQRVQQIGAANRGNMVQYVLAKSDDRQKAEEIILISITLCPTRAAAAEGLVDHLLGVQRPDFKLIEEDSLLIGDLAVHFQGTPEPAIFFFRGNILIAVENAGQKAAIGLRDLARAIDENLKKGQR